MSRRTYERNKAVRLAWEREQALVKEGKGTRDWTKQQQEDILNPEKGKAYDENKNPYEGQHMKSVAQYPDYISNPDNIQLLTKQEHFEAHKGNWGTPTNWYYNPETKEFLYFGENELIPCPIQTLSNPIIINKTALQEIEREKPQDQKKNEDTKAVSDNADSAVKREKVPQALDKNKPFMKTTMPKVSVSEKTPKSKGVFGRIVKGAGRFVVEHPAETAQICGILVLGAVKAVSRIRGSRNSNYKASSKPVSSAESQNVADRIAEVIEKASRNTPHENDVPGHMQRYHTKKGVIWKDKKPYHRGGKSS